MHHLRCVYLIINQKQINYGQNLGLYLGVLHMLAIKTGFMPMRNSSDITVELRQCLRSRILSGVWMRLGQMEGLLREIV